jgi:hypothetical protein
VVALGADFSMPDDLPTAGVAGPVDSSNPGTPAAPGAANHSGPPATEPNNIAGAGVPCVK